MQSLVATSLAKADAVEAAEAAPGRRGRGRAGPVARARRPRRRRSATFGSGPRSRRPRPGRRALVSRPAHYRAVHADCVDPAAPPRPTLAASSLLAAARVRAPGDRRPARARADGRRPGRAAEPSRPSTSTTTRRSIERRGQRPPTRRSATARGSAPTTAATTSTRTRAGATTGPLPPAVARDPVRGAAADDRDGAAVLRPLLAPQLPQGGHRPRPHHGGVLPLGDGRRHPHLARRRGVLRLYRAPRLALRRLGLHPHQDRLRRHAARANSILLLVGVRAVQLYRDDRGLDAPHPARTCGSTRGG